MIKRHFYIAFAALLVSAVLVGVLGPRLFNNRSQLPDPVEPAPLTTSSLFSDPLADTGSTDPLADTGLDETGNQPSGRADFSESNCTYPHVYWQNQPDVWPAQVMLGGRIYTKEDMWAMYAAENPDLHTLLIQQIHTSFLNVLNGSEIQPVESTLGAAMKWLEDNPPGSQLSQLTGQQGRTALRVLELYNLGEVGPGACPDLHEVLAAAATATEITAPPATAIPTRPPASQAQAESQPDSPPAPPAAPPPEDPVVEVPATATNVPPTDLPPSPVPPTDVPPTSAPPTSAPPTEVPPTDPPPTLTPEPSAQPSSTSEPPPTSTPQPPPPPTSTPEPPPPPPAESSGSCESNKDHPKGNELASAYGVSYEEIMGWHCSGWGFGEIDQAYALSRETGASVERIFEMKASGMGWGEIKKELKP